MQPSKFENIYNLTMDKIRIKYDYYYPVVSFYNSNGKINSMVDIDPNGNMSIIELSNSMMDLVNCDIANLAVNFDGNEYNPLLKQCFRISA